MWVLIGVALLALVAAPSLSRTNADKIDYSTFRERVEAGEVASVKITNETSRIKGKYKVAREVADDESKIDFTTTAPAVIPDDDLALCGRRAPRSSSSRRSPTWSAPCSCGCCRSAC